jgi:8-oxo-dGTP pyrophosphatase MutT (NUDIX family)
MTTAEKSIRSFEVVLAIPQGIQEHDVSIHFAHENDRQSSSDVNQEEQIDNIWKQRTTANSSLFNGTKFRFERVSRIRPSSVSTTKQHENKNSSITVSLGVTDYKSFLGTNCSLHWELLSPNCLASPLGNAAIVETCDKKVVLLKRSGNVGEMPHTIVMPGGHPEPEMVGINTMKDWHCMDSSPTATISTKEQPNATIEHCVAHELWDSMIREVIEETGIPRDVLGRPECIGFTRRVQNYRPDIIFFISCNLTSNHVHQLYADGPEHKSESTELMTMDRLEFVKQVIQDDSIHMPGCHRGGVELYRQYLAHRSILVPSI